MSLAVPSPLANLAPILAPILAAHPARPAGQMLGTRAALFRIWRGAVPEAPAPAMVSGAVGARFAPALTVSARVEILPLAPAAETAAERRQRLRDALYDDIFLF